MHTRSYTREREYGKKRGYISAINRLLHLHAYTSVRWTRSFVLQSGSRANASPASLRALLPIFSIEPFAKLYTGHCAMYARTGIPNAGDTMFQFDLRFSMTRRAKSQYRGIQFFFAYAEIRDVNEKTFKIFQAGHLRQNQLVLLSSLHHIMFYFFHTRSYMYCVVRVLTAQCKTCN